MAADNKIDNYAIADEIHSHHPQLFKELNAALQAGGKPQIEQTTEKMMRIINNYLPVNSSVVDDPSIHRADVLDIITQSSKIDPQKAPSAQREQVEGGLKDAQLAAKYERDHTPQKIMESYLAGKTAIIHKGETAKAEKEAALKEPAHSYTITDKGPTWDVQMKAAARVSNSFKIADALHLDPKLVKEGVALNYTQRTGSDVDATAAEQKYEAQLLASINANPVLKKFTEKATSDTEKLEMVKEADTIMRASAELDPKGAPSAVAKVAEAHVTAERQHESGQLQAGATPQTGAQKTGAVQK